MSFAARTGTWMNAMSGAFVPIAAMVSCDFGGVLQNDFTNTGFGRRSYKLAFHAAIDDTWKLVRKQSPIRSVSPTLLARAGQESAVPAEQLGRFSKRRYTQRRVSSAYADGGLCRTGSQIDRPTESRASKGSARRYQAHRSGTGESVCRNRSPSNRDRNDSRRATNLRPKEASLQDEVNLLAERRGDDHSATRGVLARHERSDG
jgi:hypothetical protein